MPPIFVYIKWKSYGVIDEVATLDEKIMQVCVISQWKELSTNQKNKTKQNKQTFFSFWKKGHTDLYSQKNTALA